MVASIRQAEASGSAFMSRNSSNAVRIKEKSKLLVKCIDANWESFSEQTETHNISETGISLWLRVLMNEIGQKSA